jgi:8-oxo-dGTP pyrophosphatase MutT (NUDIX family)
MPRKKPKQKIIKGVLHSVTAVIYHPKTKKVLMFKRHGQKWERGWEVVKGAIHFGETLKQAALREVAEETGVKVKIAKLIPRIWWTSKPYKGGRLPIKARVFICKYLSGKVKLGEPEHIGYKWMEVSEAKEKIWLENGDKMFDYLKL